MKKGYWERMASARLSRRRALAAGAGLAAGTASLSILGCGSGGGGDDGVEGDTSGLLGRAVDTRKDAQVGGTWPSAYDEDVIQMDPIINNASPTFPQLNPVYSVLIKAGIRTDRTPGAEDLVGDFVESWEFNGDGTQITMKVRNGMKWDPRPPTNGRQVSSADVRWSWEKFAEVGNSAPTLVNSRNPDAPVVGIETPDDRTVVFNMAYPYPGVVLQFSNQQIFHVMPALDDFNFGTDMRGSGPYMLEEFVPSGHAYYVRNPEWYDTPRPYFERLERTLIPEYATGLAQFKAQNIWNYEVAPNDILATKREHMDMLLLRDRQISNSINGFMNFSKRPDGLFNDVRVRRAISMMLDRDLLIEVFEGSRQFTDAGLPVENYWSSHIAPGLPEWLDPRGDELGEGAKYFQYNPEEARKLVQAAGVSMPYTAPFSHYSDRVPDDQQRFQVLIEMMSEGGIFNITSDPLLYNSSWRSARQAGGKQHQGILWHRTAGLDADIILTQMFTPNGRNSNDADGTPGVTELVLKQKSELDPKKRTEIIHDIQRQLALDWPVVPWAGTAPGFNLRWPWLANHGVFIEGNASAKSYVYCWYDESKRTA